jgi:hypothetical protein
MYIKYLISTVRQAGMYVCMFRLSVECWNEWIKNNNSFNILLCKQIEMVVVIVEGMQCNGSKMYLVYEIRICSVVATSLYCIFFIKLTLLLLLKRRLRRGRNEISLSRSHSFNYATQMQFTCLKAQRFETRFNW